MSPPETASRGDAVPVHPQKVLRGYDARADNEICPSSLLPKRDPHRHSIPGMHRDFFRRRCLVEHGSKVFWAVFGRYGFKIQVAKSQGRHESQLGHGKFLANAITASHFKRPEGILVRIQGVAAPGGKTFGNKFVGARPKFLVSV